LLVDNNLCSTEVTVFENVYESDLIPCLLSHLSITAGKNYVLTLSLNNDHLPTASTNLKENIF